MFAKHRCTQCPVISWQMLYIDLFCNASMYALSGDFLTNVIYRFWHMCFIYIIFGKHRCTHCPVISWQMFYINLTSNHLCKTSLYALSGDFLTNVLYTSSQMCFIHILFAKHRCTHCPVISWHRLYEDFDKCVVYESSFENIDVRTGRWFLHQFWRRSWRMCCI